MLVYYWWANTIESRHARNIFAKKGLTDFPIPIRVSRLSP